MKDIEEIYYFAYGSNIDPMVMLERGIKYQKRVLGILYGYGLRFNKLAKKDAGVGYANIVRSPKENTEGALYIIDKKGLKRLDMYEGYPAHYDKYIGSIHTKTIGLVDTFVYAAQKDKTKKNLFPTRDYLSHLLAGKDILSSSYYEQLKQTRTIEDESNK